MPPSILPNARPASPVDEDLQKLYNEVWAGFADEPPAAPSEKDLENIYNVYGGENDYPASQPAITVSPQTSTPNGPTISTKAAPRHSSPKLPGVRRLPPTPGSAKSSSPTFPMPSPEVYYDQSVSSRPSVYSTDSFSSYTSSSASSDLLRKATTGASGRYVPNVAVGDRPPSSGEKPPIPPHPAAYKAAYNQRASPASGPSVPSTTSSGDFSARPPGALPPNAYYDRNDFASSYQSPDFDTYDGGKYNGTDGYYQQIQHTQSQYQAQYGEPQDQPLYNQSQQQGNSKSLAVPAEISRQTSRETLNGVSHPISPTAAMTTSPVVLSPYEGYGDPRLQINPPGSSSGLVNVNASTASFRDYEPVAGPSTFVTGSVADESWNQADDYSYTDPQDNYEEESGAGPGHMPRRPTDMLRTLADYNTGPLELHDEGEGEYWEDEDEDDENRFVNYSLLSHIAVQLRDKIPRGTHVKGSIPYPRAFTGKDIVSTIQTQIQRELAINHGVSTNDRRVALQVARSLQSQLFFYEVEWGGRVLQDGVEDVYMFLNDLEGGSELVPELEELPTGVITMLTRCYSPSCGEGARCYSFSCPRKGNHVFGPLPTPLEAPSVKRESWAETVDSAVLKSLPETEINRQTIIHKLISKEEQYLQDLDIVESVFIKPLRTSNPPLMRPDVLDDFIDDVFGNILDLRECNRRLLEVMYVRQREQAPIIQRIGDIFLDAATEFRLAYPTYIGHYPLAEKRLKDEIDNNPEFRLFLEHCSRQSPRSGEALRFDLKHFLNRPSEHLQKYPVLLEAIFHETAVGNPDADFLVEAIEAIKNLQSVAQLRTFQSAMGKGTPGKWEWHDLVSPEIRKSLSKEEGKRQSIIFELIKGEMAYVKDLENIDIMYIQPLRAAEPSIISRDRLDQFIEDVFHNFAELHLHHRKLVTMFHEIQREQHPTIRSITAAMFDAALNFRDAYMEYIPNYPIAAYRIDDEMANNLPFKTFVEQCVRHPDAHRLDMKNFINRPIPRLLRYELLLKGIMDETKPPHEDLDTIPNVVDVIKALGKETEPGVFSAKQKVELWRYNSNLVFKAGESIDMDLLNQNRSLIHSGKLLRQPESGLEWNGWSELFVLLFDNYLVMTKPKERDGVVKYHVNRRPIPLDLLTLVNFTDPPTQRGTGLLRNLRGGERHGESANPNMPAPDSAIDSRSVHPLTIHHNGRMGGPYILYAESAQIRTEWKQKLEEALGLRKAVQDSNKVFEVETLSAETFLVPSMSAAAQGPAWNQESTYTGKVTCSVPFSTPDGRALVAIGCAEGVWIGFRHDPKSMRRVLHLKMVTQCAMLEEFGIFLVLADKSLFAYHIEALVPSSPHGAHTSQVPQKLNGTKDVHFFSVGTLHGRTLIIYMKKKGLDSIFRVLEPVNDKINERVKAPVGFGSRLGFRSAKSEWFRIYRDFFLPSESFDLIFLKARIAILCAKGFEIMDLQNFNSVTIPQREDPKLAQLSKRCESCRPMGMFRSADDEFLLCYDEFGIYVDKHGDPSRGAATIEWEGTAERVALHSPYVLLFDTRFIEIRHIETGRLAQIIPGNEVRCIWDGRGVGSNDPNTSANEGGNESLLQEAQVHAVMNSTDVVPGNRGRTVAQHVFELIPTIPLYLPSSGPVRDGRRLSYSPAPSPELRTSTSWRS